jgi:hypothetical protein
MNLLWTNGIIFRACIILGIDKKLCSNRWLFICNRYVRKKNVQRIHKRFWPCRMKVMAVICHTLKSDAHPAANSALQHLFVRLFVSCSAHAHFKSCCSWLNINRHLNFIWKVKKISILSHRTTCQNVSLYAFNNIQE